MLRPYAALIGAVRPGRWALPTFNTFNLETTQAILRGAAVERAPVVLEISERSLAHAGGAAFMQAVETLADESPIPVALHYDHGESVALVENALRLPFSSVMLAYDVARSLAANITAAKRIVRAAHRRHVSVQGEVGHVTGPKDHWRLPVEWLTDPAAAVKYVAETGVDTLAASVGNRHGVAAGSVQLDWPRLIAIRRAVDLPLVLHGGSGLRIATYGRAVAAGISTINFDTDLRYAFGTTLKLNLRLQRDLLDPRKPLERAGKAVEKVVRQKIRACRAQGRAAALH